MIATENKSLSIQTIIILLPPWISTALPFSLEGTLNNEKIQAEVIVLQMLIN